MFHNLLKWLSAFVITVISGSGYIGIILLMALESACIPIPSEVIMPFSGFLASQGRFDLFITALSGASGCALGSAISYFVGYIGGEKFILKYGKYVLVSHKDFYSAKKWLNKYGLFASFISRLLPVIRTFISLPCGVAKIKFLPFIAYSFFGSFLWCYVLAFLGYELGENWSRIEIYFRKFDIVIASLIAFCVIFFLYKKIREIKTEET